MKKTSKKTTDMRPEYDFSKGTRSKYAGRVKNIVVLSPDLQDVFPDSKAVNDALRPLAQIIRKMKSRAG